MARPQDNRPLSPFMLGTYYRFQISSLLSILHRITGVGLAFGLLVFAAWLWAAAYSPDCYASIQAYSNTLLGKIFYFGWTLAFYYHFGNGIRHLNWDRGHGFTIPEATRSGWVVVTFAITMTVFTWAVIYRQGVL